MEEVAAAIAVEVFAGRVVEVVDAVEAAADADDEMTDGDAAAVEGDGGAADGLEAVDRPDRNH